MLKSILIDDEEAGIKTLEILASRHPSFIHVVASSTQAEEGITLIEKHKPDLVFLDIQMPGMNGFDLLERLSFRNFRLVFTTAHREYALQAIKQKAFDYLLKPISGADFRKCIEDIYAENDRRQMPKKETHLFTEIRVKDGVLYLKQKDIVRLEASGSYTTFFMDNGTKHVASRKLGDFEPQLDPQFFHRCHKSHIINLQKVQKFIHTDGFYALMSDGSTPDISKQQKDLFLQRLKEL